MYILWYFFVEELMIQIVLVADKLREYTHKQKNFGDIHVVQFGGVRTSGKTMPNNHLQDKITRWRHLTNYIFLYLIALYHFYIIIFLITIHLKHIL